MRNEEDIREWHQEMLDEAREDELAEIRLRSDYDYFLDYCNVELLQEEYCRIKKLHEDYGYDFNIMDII